MAKPRPATPTPAPVPEPSAAPVVPTATEPTPTGYRLGMLDGRVVMIPSLPTYPTAKGTAPNG